LAAAIATEASELQEFFLWKSGADGEVLGHRRSEVAEELAGIAICLLSFADVPMEWGAYQLGDGNGAPSLGALDAGSLALGLLIRRYYVLYEFYAIDPEIRSSPNPSIRRPKAS
jgi:hypothetical protein